MTPKFLDVLENGWAGESNPHRKTIYIRTVRRTGKLNPGKFYVTVGFDGEETLLRADNERLSIIGNLLEGYKP